jgi:hypothetical protein
MAAAIGCAVLLASGPARAVTVTVEQDLPWLGFMNVFELPANGGGYVFGSPWGTADLVATFSGDVLTLAPNTIGDPAEFWYQGGGAPGNPGNKIMDANFYIEDDALNGEVLTFEGTVLANSLTSAHNATAFIRDFAPDYSSFETITAPLTPGPFTITYPTLGAPGRHIQYGFNVNGPNVWVTDVAPFGSVQISAPGGDPVPGDFNDDQMVDAADLAEWRTAFGNTAEADGDGDGDSDGHDFLIWQQNLNVTPVTAIPEPATAAMLAIVLTCAAAGLRKRLS